MQLFRAGWLERTGHFDGHRTQIDFYLSKRAYRSHVLLPGVNDRREQLKSDKIEHDVRLVDLRACLESRETVTHFYTENVLQSRHDLAEAEKYRDSRSLHSDAVLDLLIEKEFRYVLPFEYEGSQKSKDRWAEKLLDYYLKHEAQAVLWVCETDSIARAMGETDLSLSTGRAPKMYFATAADVLSRPEKLKFLNAKKDKSVVL